MACALRADAPSSLSAGLDSTTRSASAQPERGAVCGAERDRRRLRPCDYRLLRLDVFARAGVAYLWLEEGFYVSATVSPAVGLRIYRDDGVRARLTNLGAAFAAMAGKEWQLSDLPLGLGLRSSYATQC